MRRGRLIKGVLIFGLLGAIANLAVAWGIAYWMPMPQGFASGNFGVFQWALTPPNSFPAHATRSGGWEDAGIVRVSQGADADTADAINRRRGEAKSLGTGAPSKASGQTIVLDSTFIESAESAYYARITRVGWPLVAFEGVRFEHHRISPSLPMVESMSWAIGSSSNAVAGIAADHQRLIPYRPMLPGFVINTALYGIALWLLVATPMAFIRWRRGRRVGVCAKCGYDLRGATHERCPECGSVIHVVAT